MKKLKLVCDESIIRVQSIQTTAEEDKVERGSSRAAENLIICYECNILSNVAIKSPRC